MSLLMTLRRRPRYQVYDRFTTAVSPLTTRNAEPGPGAIAVVTDTESKLAISGGAQTASGGKATPAIGDPGVWYGGSTRIAGRAMFTTINPGATNKQLNAGWDTNQLTGISDGIQFLGTALASALEAGVAVALAFTYTAVAYDICVVLRPTGALVLMKGGTLSVWTLMWAGYSLSTGTMFPAIANFSAAYSDTRVDVIDLGTLSAAWGRDFGIAPGRLAGARSAGDTFTHPADTLLVFTLTTLPSAGSVQVQFRMQDASNYWMVDIASTGAINLYEVVAGVSTSRANGTGIASTNRITVIADGATIKMFANQTQKGTTYSSATNFQTATSGAVLSLGTGGAVTNMDPWQRYPVLPRGF